MTWEGLNPPYPPIVADPPWDHPDGWPGWSNGIRSSLPYSSMTLESIGSLPVAELAEPEAYLFCWTTNRYIEDAYHIVREWDFTPRQLLVWCKTPRGLGPGGMFATTTEFVIVAQRIGRNSHARKTMTSGTRLDTSWFEWPRGNHSEKPAAFFDLVEEVTLTPRVELFARQPRLGWDSWGWGYEAAS